MRNTVEELPTGFVGASPKILQIRERIQHIAQGKTPVLILGETGTGKEVAARSVYNANPKGQFVPIDCGSLVGPLMESELFGHARHSFTGAGEAKRGLMELAHGGVAFFDEIGDLALELQVKLLRVLQEHEFRAVGSLQRTRIDVRVVAATHRNLEKEVASGRFREDLYHRLNVTRISLPPLRERKEDIPALVERFLASSGRRFVLAHESMAALLAYDWPGNIRELKNCIDRMTDCAEGTVLSFAQLPTAVVFHARAGQMAKAATVGSGATMDLNPFPPELVERTAKIVPLSELEKRAISEALIETRGDRTIAAQLLGIGRTTLYRKLKEYALSPEGWPTC
ncbi:MAG: sigma-54 dependent transcriptional regulator [Phycisphaerae bacterium]